MPYRIIERDGEHCVQKTTDDQIMGCHETDDEAIAQMRALYASEESETQQIPNNNPREKKTYFNQLAILSIRAESSNNFLPAIMYISYESLTR